MKEFICVLVCIDLKCMSLIFTEISDFIKLYKKQLGIMHCDFSYSGVSNQDVKNSTMHVYFISKVYRNIYLVLSSAQEL